VACGFVFVPEVGKLFGRNPDLLKHDHISSFEGSEVVLSVTRNPLTAVFCAEIISVPVPVFRQESYSGCGHLVLDLPVDSNCSIGSDPNLIGRCANPQKVSVRRNHAHNRAIFR
jgi:hypothetical protein